MGGLWGMWRQWRARRNRGATQHSQGLAMFNLNLGRRDISYLPPPPNIWTRTLSPKSSTYVYCMNFMRSHHIDTSHHSGSHVLGTRRHSIKSVAFRLFPSTKLTWLLFRFYCFSPFLSWLGLVTLNRFGVSVRLMTLGRLGFGLGFELV
jgi:hypothetical protein